MALEKIKLTLEHPKILQTYDIKLNLVNNMKRYIVFNYIVPTFYNVFIKPTKSMLYKNKYTFFNKWYHKLFCHNVHAIKNKLRLFNVSKKKQIYERYNMRIPLTYTLNLDNKITDIYRKNLTKNKIIGYFDKNKWNTFKYIFYTINKTVLRRFKKGALADKVIYFGNTIKSLDSVNHIDYNYISVSSLALDNNIRYKHNNLYKDPLKRLSNINQKIAYTKTPKHLHYEELCAYFTLHKSSVSDQYVTYWYSETLNKLQYFILRNKWYMYIKDFLISNHKMINTSKQMNKLYPSELGIDIAVKVFLSNTDKILNVLNMRTIIKLLRELTFLENSNLKSMDMVKWYVYLNTHIRNKLKNVNTFDYTYRAIYRRLYKVNKVKIYKVLNNRFKVKNKNFLRRIYDKLKNSKLIRAVTTNKKEYTRLSTQGVYIENKRRRLLRKKIFKWYDISNKLGIRLDKTFFWKVYSFLIVGKISKLRHTLVKNKVINKLLSVYSVRRTSTSKRTKKSVIRDKLRYYASKKNIFNNNAARALTTIKGDIIREITNKIYNTFYKSNMSNAKDSDIEHAFSGIQLIQYDSIDIDIIEQPTFIRAYNIMISVMSRIKATIQSASITGLQVIEGIHTSKKPVKKINNKAILSYSNTQPTNMEYKDNSIYIYKHQRYLILNYMALYIKQCCFICYTTNQFSIYKNYIFIYNLNEPIIYSSNNIYNPIFIEWFYNINMRDFF